jgi:NADPH:quinone reductase-like Zn-dependent oxidoreductase
VTIAAGNENATDQRIKDGIFIVEPSRKQLIEVAKLFDAGTLHAFVSAVVPLEQAALAYSRAAPRKGAYGKVVVAVPA